LSCGSRLLCCPGLLASRVLGFRQRESCLF
jgi:hypothetical protein